MQQLGKVQTQTTWAKASDTINKNSDKIYEAVTQVENATIRNKGYFLSSSELKEAYPNPIAGMTAFVYNQDNDPTYPYDIYQSFYDEETGAWMWRDTSNDAPFPEVDIDSINNAIQRIQDDIEDLPSIRDNIAAFTPKVISPHEQEAMEKDGTWEAFLEINPIVYVTEE